MKNKEVCLSRRKNKYTKKEIIRQKKVAYYQELVSAWINTKMERDKSILAISTLGIGVSVTLLSTIGINNIFELVAFGISIVLFICIIFTVITILDKNSKHIEDVIINNITEDKRLKRFDKLTKYLLIIAILFTLSGGASSAYNKYKKVQEDSMSEDSKKPFPNATNKKVIKESIEGVGKLKPQGSSSGSTSEPKGTSKKN